MTTFTPAGTRLLTPQEAADFLKLRPDTLRIWRRDRRGPQFVRLGNRVRYRVEDLEAFIAERAAKDRFVLRALTS